MNYAVQRHNNSATIKNLIPEGDKMFIGNMTEEVEVTLTVPAVYGIKYPPHCDMGLIMLIEVGEDIGRRMILHKRAEEVA